MLYYSFHDVDEKYQKVQLSTQDEQHESKKQNNDLPSDISNQIKSAQAKNPNKENNKNMMGEKQFINIKKSIEMPKATYPIYDVYWVNAVGGGKGGIYGGKTDALDVPSRIIGVHGRIKTVAVDKKGNIYWSNNIENAIYRADKNGDNITRIISGLSHPLGIAIDNKRGRIYWADWQQKIKKGFIGYSNLDGSESKLIVVDQLKSGGDIFYDTKYDILYISDLFGAKIMRLDLKNYDLSKLTHAEQPGGLAVDYKNRRVVWADTGNDSIMSVRFDGSDKYDLIKFESAFANPEALTLDEVNNQLIYAIHNNDVNSGDQIELSNLDGSKRRVINKLSNTTVKSLFYLRR
jgi:hypothetical protein